MKKEKIKDTVMSIKAIILIVFTIGIVVLLIVSLIGCEKSDYTCNYNSICDTDNENVFSCKDCRLNLGNKKCDLERRRVAECNGFQIINESFEENINYEVEFWDEFAEMYNIKMSNYEWCVKILDCEVSIYQD